MSKRRDYIPLKEKLAAALRQIGDIPYEHARQMDADQIIALFHCDHGIYKTWEESPGEYDKHWNLTFRFIGPHRAKTKTDVGVIAKVNRLSKSQEEFQRKMLAKSTSEICAEIGEELAKPKSRFANGRSKSKIPSRPMPKSQRKMQSRNTFAERRKAKST